MEKWEGGEEKRGVCSRNFQLFLTSLFQTLMKLCMIFVPHFFLPDISSLLHLAKS